MVSFLLLCYHCSNQGKEKTLIQAYTIMIRFLKNAFYCRSDRVTVQEREKMELDQERKEVEKKKNAEERTKISRKVS